MKKIPCSAKRGLSRWNGPVPYWIPMHQIVESRSLDFCLSKRAARTNMPARATSQKALKAPG
jgi:hypothetical protein